MGLFDFLFGKKDKKTYTPASNSQESLLEKVEVMPGLSIPKAFALHWSEIEQTKMRFISITATPKEALTLTKSKFGYYPYMPLSFDYPKDGEGNYMYPLVQINCSEMPALAGYPASGYLQFYISAFEDVYGLDFDDQQSQEGFRVLYFEEAEIENHKTDFSFLKEVMESDQLPLNRPFSLSFAAADEFVGEGDVRYDGSACNLFTIAEKYPAIEEELKEAAYDDFSSSGHKVGGYAYFTQTDPRSYTDKFKDYILLFQMDTDDEIMWGDSGVANFFIHPDDLAKKDFTKVMYNWDCC